MFESLLRQEPFPRSRKILSLKPTQRHPVSQANRAPEMAAVSSCHCPLWCIVGSNYNGPLRSSRSSGHEQFEAMLTELLSPEFLSPSSRSLK
jgi:hypothetical protein